jgi:hypothetical protein
MMHGQKTIKKIDYTIFYYNSGKFESLITAIVG